MRTEKEIRKEIEAVREYRKKVTTKSVYFRFRLVKIFKRLINPMFQLAHVLGQEDMAKWILEEEGFRGIIDDLKDSGLESAE